MKKPYATKYFCCFSCTFLTVKIYTRPCTKPQSHLRGPRLSPPIKHHFPSACKGRSAPTLFPAQENPSAAPRPRDSAASPPSTSIRVVLPRPSPFTSTLQGWPAVPAAPSAAGTGQTAPAADDGSCRAEPRRPASSFWQVLCHITPNGTKLCLNY